MQQPSAAHSQPIRVARIITRLNIGGPAIQAINLSSDLRQAGFDTLLVHGRLGNGEGDMTTLLPLRETEGVFIDDLRRPIAPMRDVRALWRIYRELCRWQPHVVHTHMAKAGTVGRLAAIVYNSTRGKERPARIVHTYHGHVFEGYFGSLSTKMFLAIERWLGRRTDAIIAISNQVRHDIVDEFRLAREPQVAMIPLGFDLDPLLRLTAEDRSRSRTALHIPASAIVVSTVGRLTAIKQHSLFLQMAARLVRRSDRFVFLIAGDGELKAQLQRQAAELGIATQTQFLGWRGDLTTIYGASDVFVLTSRNEGTPVALIEAMAAGVPAVSTDVGGVHDVIATEKLGVLVPFGDPDLLAVAVERLASDPARGSEIATAGRLFARDRFDSRRLVADISALYWRLLGVRTTMQ